MNAKVLLLLLVLLIAPVSAITSDITIIRAEHREGNCIYNDDRTTANCTLAYTDATAKLQAIVAGNHNFKFDLRRTRGGLFTKYGLAWQMPSYYGSHQNSMVVYQTGAVVRKLSVRDGCWYNLDVNRVWCPAVVLGDGMNTMVDDLLMV